MVDFLDEKRAELEERLRELRPVVDEYHRLEAAASALAGVGTSTSGEATTWRRRLGRPRSAVGRKTKKIEARGQTKRLAATRAGRPTGPERRKSSGTRAAQALALVRSQPGITIPELAAQMGIKQNYLYRVMSSLEEGGRVKKQGRRWHPNAF